LGELIWGRIWAVFAAERLYICKKNAILLLLASLYAKIKDFGTEKWGMKLRFYKY
jgi:hypothetical protein